MLHPVKRWRRLLMAAMTLVAFVTCLMSRQIYSNEVYYTLQTDAETDVEVDYDVSPEDLKPLPENWRGLTQAQISNMSTLGRRLFLEDMSASPRLDKNFTILVWKHGPALERRHIMRHDPFGECSVSNCRLTYDSADLKKADAVLFHLHRTPGRTALPERHAHASQRWVFLTDENPFHTFTLSGGTPHMRDFNGLFNWSMTYRMDSDVPVPSGRTLPLNEEERMGHRKLRRKRKNKVAAIMVSNCGGKNHRFDYVQQLQKHMHVDVYGTCGPLKCEGHFAMDCPKLDAYKFYLAFENGDCREYVTEKAWWNGYHKGAVPVIMGASLEECARILPPKSYLHVRNFSSPASLARYLMYLAESPTEYARLHHWRRRFKVVNEHGYFQSPVHHYCRLCEALNYNDPSPKVYDDLERFWSTERDCYESVI
ncbi:hypothetical protein C0J52_18593 [Blattella germanica]|nr:hypothetical protein C0J52_18593 [Blattella germanica]